MRLTASKRQAAAGGGGGDGGRDRCVDVHVLVAARGDEVGEFRDVGGDACDRERRLGGGGEGTADLPVTVLGGHRPDDIAHCQHLGIGVGVRVDEPGGTCAQLRRLRRNSDTVRPRGG